MRIAAASVLFLAVLIPTAGAQDPTRPSYPSREYYAGLQLFRDGALVQAAEGFAAAQRRGRRDASGRWIDSIPPLAMMGEVQYQMGNLVGAQENFDAVLALAMQHEASLAALDWPGQLLPSGGVPPINVTWWAGGRRIQPAALPDQVNVGIGEMSAERVLQSGGVFQAAQFVGVDAVEILRGIGISAYRRAEILGVMASDDPVTKRAAEMSGRMVARGTPVSAPMWLTIQGLLLAANDQPEGAAGALQSGSTIGPLEHPLSPLAALGMARLMRAEGQTEGLRRLGIEASASAALLEQPEWAAEAIRITSGTLVSGVDEVLLASSVAMADVYARRSRFAAVAANAVAADCAATAGNAAAASGYLGNIQVLMRDRNAVMPRTQATAAWIQSRVLASTGQMAEATAAAARAVAFGQGNGAALVGAPSLLQRQLYAAALDAGSVAGEKEETRFTELLDPPSAAHWARDPVDALSAAVADQSAVRAAQLARTIARGDAAAALRAADALVRSQLRAALPLGGRPLDLRWLVAGPMNALEGTAVELRRNLPGPLATLNQSQLRSAAIRDALAGLELGTDDAAARNESAELWKELAALSEAMEATVMAAALDRVVVPHVFPPPWQASEEAPVPSGAAVVTFVSVGNQYFGIAMVADGATMWPVENSQSLRPQIVRLLTDIGVGRRRAGQPQLPTGEAWRAIAASLREQLLPSGKLDLEDLQRLVVVPSGPLWYLPFELLPESGEDAPLVGDRIAVSYMPTPGLAIHPPPSTAVGDSVGYVSNLFFAPKVPEVEAEWVDKLSQQPPGAVSLPAAGSIPGRFISARLRTVWVAAADQGPAVGGAALQYSPLLYDANSKRGSFADWLRFPWGAPQTVLLPGLRSKLSGDGSDLLFTIFALQASGTPQALVARWPVGGVSTATALGEMLQELPMLDALGAWRRAIQVLRGSELDPTAEPLLSEGDRGRTDLTGDHPIFWSGYMVVQGLEGGRRARTREAAPPRPPQAMPEEPQGADPEGAKLEEPGPEEMPLEMPEDDLDEAVGRGSP